MTVGGEIDSQTGMVINLVEVDRILKEVTGPMDHHHLNLDLEAFREVVPTTENVAKYCFLEIKKKLPTDITLARVRLYENENLWADFCG
jgi:6-pyruvoyltetrahydropterin/6-carboxytetrahydropterin synthase